MYRYPQAAERYARLADYLGLGGDDVPEKVERLILAIDRLKKQLELPGSIGDAGIDETQFRDRLDEMSEAAFDDQCTGTNPRFPLIEEIKRLYELAYRGEVDEVESD
jgi:acetaldehyde dehydrogenase/alcohol dehydrogenase